MERILSTAQLKLLELTEKGLERAKNVKDQRRKIFLQMSFVQSLKLVLSLQQNIFLSAAAEVKHNKGSLRKERGALEMM